MNHKRLIARLVAMLVVTGVNSLAQSITFSDQDFNDTDWTATVIIDETSSAEIEALQELRGGNPGAFRRIHHVGQAGSQVREIHVAHLRAGATYDPQTQGPIAGISHSYDLKNLETRTIWDSTFYLLVVQNDTYYRPPTDTISRLDWSPFGRSGLDSGDFTRVSGDGPRRPNFSDSGAPLQFGFGSVSEFPGEPGDDSRNSGIDNWEVTIVGQGAPSCQIQPRNTYLPTHFLEPHLFNPDGHPPHELGVAVTLGATPLSGVNVSLVANKPLFLDASGSPSLTTTAVQTDSNGRAVLKYVPPSQGSFDQTDIEAGGSVDGTSFSCRGIVVTGLGALTASYQGLRNQQASLMLLRRVWEKLLARTTIDQDPAELSREFSNQIERIAWTNAAFLSRLGDTVKKHRPLLERIAAEKPVIPSEDALNEIEALLDHLEAQAGSELRRAVRRVQGYLANVRRLANLTDPIGRTPLRGQRRQSAAQPTKTEKRTHPVSPRIHGAYRKLQLSFEANVGQASSDVRYLARGPGYNLYLLPQEAVLVNGLASRGPVAPPSVVRIQLVGSRPGSNIEGVDRLPGKTHYLFGKNPADWHTDVPQFAKVKYEEIYPGIDLVYYGNQSQLEYDFVIAPGASADTIALAFDGVRELQLDDRGDLVLDAGREQFRLKKPFIYREIEGVRRHVAGHYSVVRAIASALRLKPTTTLAPW